jgi:hypothetical protein
MISKTAFSGVIRTMCGNPEENSDFFSINYAPGGRNGRVGLIRRLHFDRLRISGVRSFSSSRILLLTPFSILHFLIHDVINT